MRGAFAFLTTLGGAERPAPGSLRWFPVVGLVVGGALGATWWGAVELWPPLLAAVLVVIVELALTGLLHVDGLADTADGVLVHGASRERRLEIMRTPDIGAYGAAVVVVVLLARVAALASMDAAPLLLAGLWTASRTVMAVVPALVPYARDEGLASSFLIRPAERAVAVALLPAGGLCVVGAGGPGGAGLAALLLAAAVTVLVARRRLGGFTGDVLGAAAVVGETAGLVAAAARW